MPKNSDLRGPQKSRRGRPSWVSPDLTQVEKLASKGATFEEIAYGLNIAPSTLYKHKRDFLDFSEALKRGRAKGIVLVENRLFTEALRGNIAAMIFYLKARAGWRDGSGSGAQVDVNISGTEMAMEKQRERQARLAELSKIPIDVRLKMRDLLLKRSDAERRSRPTRRRCRTTMI